MIFFTFYFNFFVCVWGCVGLPFLMGGGGGSRGEVGGRGVLILPIADASVQLVDGKQPLQHGED